MTLPPTCQLCVDVELTENTAGPYIILPTTFKPNMERGFILLPGRTLCRRLAIEFGRQPYRGSSSSRSVRFRRVVSQLGPMTWSIPW